MVSDKFMVNSDAGRMAAARYAADNYAWHAGLDKRDALQAQRIEQLTDQVKADGRGNLEPGFSGSHGKGHICAAYAC